MSAADGGTGTYGYGLFANYADAFLPAIKNGIEPIFSAPFKSNSLGQGNNQNSRSILTAIPGLTGSYARLELVFEYQRWFDLIRQKDAAGNSTFVANLQKVGKTNAQPVFSCIWSAETTERGRIIAISTPNLDRLVKRGVAFTRAQRHPSPEVTKGVLRFVSTVWTSRKMEVRNIRGTLPR